MPRPEALHVDLVIFGDKSTFNREIARAISRIEEICNIVRRSPASPVTVVLDITTPDHVTEDKVYFRTRRAALRTLLIAIGKIPLIESLYMNIVKQTATRGNRSPQHPDAYVGMMGQFFFQTGRVKDVPSLALRVETTIDDTPAWVYMSRRINEISSPTVIPSLRELSVVLNFKKVPDLDATGLDYNLTTVKRSIIMPLLTLQRQRPGVDVKYHLEGALNTPYEFIHSKDIHRLNRIRRTPEAVPVEQIARALGNRWYKSMDDIIENYTTSTMSILFPANPANPLVHLKAPVQAIPNHSSYKKSMATLLSFIKNLPHSNKLKFIQISMTTNIPRNRPVILQESFPMGEWQQLGRLLNSKSRFPHLKQLLVDWTCYRPRRSEVYTEVEDLECMAIFYFKSAISTLTRSDAIGYLNKWEVVDV